MLRYLLVLLAVLVAVLAYLFDRPWLWVGAGVMLAGGLALLIWRTWSTYSKTGERATASRAEPDGTEASLEELGIMDIRPEEESTDSSERESGEEGEEGNGEPPDPSSSGQLSSPEVSAAGEHPVTRAPSEARSPESEETDEPASSGPVVTDDAPVLGPLLVSLRAALEAETVCLLVQEEVALTYRIEVLASRHSAVRSSGTFDTQTPLLTARMSRHAVGIRSLQETELAIEDLGYYESPPRIDHLAVAPVPRPDQPSTTFLLVDATKGTDLGASRARTLLERFAETVDELLPPHETGLGSVQEADGAVSDEPPPGTDESEDPAPRPRREIIAEEIEAAETESEALALVLVHLNRAESIGRRGEEAVASAERLLRARLEQAAPNERVERFGELTYGVFFRGGADTVEPWVADLEAAMDREEGELEGGVSVGVAVRRDHDAESLRTEATEALREAYKTGTSTIVA